MRYVDFIPFYSLGLRLSQGFDTIEVSCFE